MLLFVVSFAYVAHFYRRTHARKNPGSEKAPQEQQQTYPAPLQGYAQRQGYAQAQGYAQQPADCPQQATPAQYVQGQPYDPYFQQQNTGYAGTGGYYAPDQTQRNQQQPMYNPQRMPECRLLDNIISHLRIDQHRRYRHDELGHMTWRLRKR
ncbi:hypothetical protein DL765_011181 [Monosporascus sp. GIB2]|nr:hypothetical protein DL765_011181 [Monosporascus sp. GIB2]